MTEYIELLKKLIATPSFSKEEHKTAELIAEFLLNKGLAPKRYLNNIWIEHPANRVGRPCILLNSHHDTVKPSSSWHTDPFLPIQTNGKIYGLGSNDAGASLVSLMAAFIHFYDKLLPFNLIYALTAEEENSGTNGLESILEKFGKLDLAIVGEPTEMEMAVAEKGLMVLDCSIAGIAGHAARDEGENAIYKSLAIIEWFKNLDFPKVSEFIGKVKTTVTQISAGNQHNVVPDLCNFVVDVRTNGMYTNTEILEYIKTNAGCNVNARSLRLNSSSINLDHPVVFAAKKTGISLFGSPTTSDQAIIPYPSVKIGPGDSARSHTANEFICLSEIENGIKTYINLLENIQF